LLLISRYSGNRIVVIPNGCRDLCLGSAVSIAWGPRHTKEQGEHAPATFEAYRTDMTTGRITYLNGTSSAGKSSIAKALQEILPEPYLHLGIDAMMWMLPDRYRPGQPEGAHFTVSADGAVKPVPGPVQRRLRSGLYAAVDALARTSLNVIIDDVLQGPEALREAVDRLGDHEVLFVGIHCPIAVLEERERTRENRIPGIARGMLAAVHAHAIYDLEIDTSQASAIECAREIQRHLQDGPKPTAFRRLQRRLAASG
jgi:chloramphenicol 3-O phosphotransferase